MVLPMTAMGTETASAVMGRLARGRHNRLRVEEGDTIVFSAHAIPGNEELVYRTINQLYRRGANVLYEGIAKVHVSGHASREEMKLLINLIRPRFLVPVHGELRHLKQHGQMAIDLGIPPEQVVVIENGTPIELTPNSIEVLPRLRGGYIFVDGASVGDIDWPVLRDRDKLAQSGFFFAVVSTNGDGRLLDSPEIVTRGFLDRRDGEEVISGAKDALERAIRQFKNSDNLQKQLEDSLGRYLYAETGRRPIVQVMVQRLLTESH